MSIREQYEEAFADRDSHFLTWHTVDSKQNEISREWTRGEFYDLAVSLGASLQQRGCLPGDCVVLCMGGNQVYDLAIRVAAVLTGIVPVTVNWQADTFETICYKIEACNAGVLIFDDLFDKEKRSRLEDKFSGLICLDCFDMQSEAEIKIHDTKEDDTRIIIFTSGTTGKPKGVRLPYRSYECNRQTFEHFLQIKPQDKFALCCVNPLHHTNSTAVTDWALRRPGTHLHLVERYSTQYWKTIAGIGEAGYSRIIAPTVSRHFDFLEQLDIDNKLPLELDRFCNAAKSVEFLIGSAPVGPQTVKCLQKYTGSIPLIRFGSTETCLQVMGTPPDIDEKNKEKILQVGWQHQWQDEDQSGYWVGRDHQPHTHVSVVRSTNPDDPDYMQECGPGEPGLCITKGRHIMDSYVNNEEATREVLQQGWYTGLGDVVFYLENEVGAKDFYWQSRVSNLLIRGGSNYSCDAIANMVQDYLLECFSLAKEDYDIAVTGLRINSEHEDECCVALNLLGKDAAAVQERLQNEFIEKSKGKFSKGCKPDLLVFTEIPRNFKGALLMNELRDTVKTKLQSGK
ncbi:MAG: AMP-binding protein [Planctomycetota bacterium]|jgi:acyl-CoA synthetase (AMP-forming)/AMP-acid ligase II